MIFGRRSPPHFSVRAAAAADLSPLSAFIARLNSVPQTASLHCSAVTPASVRAALRAADTFGSSWEAEFVVAVDPDGSIIGALGCQLDDERNHGWLWGPWVGEGLAWSDIGPALLDHLHEQLPAGLRQMEAFLDTKNIQGLAFLRARNFSFGTTTHVYVATPETRHQPPPRFAPFPLLRPAHEVAFARLHAEIFPAGRSTPAADLLAGRDDDHAIFAATDGLSLRGYVCVSLNSAPREGFIEYLAVKPNVRRHGIGRALLETALQWTFQERRLPQGALCVSEWRDDARRLYESAGFKLLASGVAARLAIGSANR